jgi:DNA-binding MarR family transcriptional regulator
LEYWLGRNLRRATNAVVADFMEEFAQFDLRPAQFTVLVAVENNPGASGAELSEWMDVPRTNTVVVLRELEDRGLIERSATDQRTQAIALTRKGKELMPRLHAAHARHRRNFDAMMSREEKELLIALLSRIWRPDRAARPAAAQKAKRTRS